MFSKIEFKNFMSFSNLTFDLLNRGKCKDIIAIYGENGSGKTNIVEAFKLLVLSLQSMESLNENTRLQSLLKEQTNKEENQKTNFGDISEILDKISFFTTFKGIAKNTHRIASEGNTILKYYFNIEKDNGYYLLEYNENNELVKEELVFKIKSNKGVHFSITNIDGLSQSLNKTIFKNTIFKDLTEQIEKYWGKHTFLSIFNNYCLEVNEEFINEQVSINFQKVVDEFDKIFIWSGNFRGPFHSTELLLKDISKGKIDKSEKEKLSYTEEIIYKYFSALYIDIKDVKYKQDAQGQEIKYELMIRKNIGGDLLDVPISLESQGTKNLLDLLKGFNNVLDGKICIVDEIDSGIHDLLMNSILNDLKGSVNGQLIFTTHDTTLLKELSPSSAYFLNVDIKGNKVIISGNEADKKIGVNNNLEKLYLSGFFGAVPDPLDIDFSDLFLDHNLSED
ncbi:transporter [Streptococcus sp. FDAARGOS_521]|uniref:AAA family ATPase n=1 Tax=Streptococcus sp. FDAARGOS_521 TaxID=2420309 RepID=UPI000F50DEA5|nr:AAA family ATPase [Streptococcus sp. FDAARGOS_521]AYY67812.1 transporter [Streptococcus sp. FDAARGOS_521]